MEQTAEWWAQLRELNACSATLEAKSGRVNRQFDVLCGHFYAPLPSRGGAICCPLGQIVLTT
jgi:hypothetical protein